MGPGKRSGAMEGTRLSSFGPGDQDESVLKFDRMAGAEDYSTLAGQTGPRAAQQG